MTNDTAERIEEVSDDLRIVYRLERASSKWWCIAERLEPMVRSEKWERTGWFKRGFDGTQRPGIGELRVAFDELRDACINGEDTVEQTIEEVFDGMDKDHARELGLTDEPRQQRLGEVSESLQEGSGNRANRDRKT